MRSLFLIILIASAVASCKQDDPGPLGANASFVGNEMIWLSDTSWVYDSLNHVYNAKAFADILDADAVSHYEVKIGVGTFNSGDYLPFTVDSVAYTATYKEDEVDLKATPMTDSVSNSSLAKSFVVFLFK